MTGNDYKSDSISDLQRILLTLTTEQREVFEKDLVYQITSYPYERYSNTTQQPVLSAYDVLTANIAAIHAAIKTATGLPPSDDLK